MWIKKGLIFNKTGCKFWNFSHCQVPIAYPFDNIIRIFYASRDKFNQSRISYFDVDKADLTKIVYAHDKPVLDLGLPGTFDDSGVMPTSFLNVNSSNYLYYIGWTIKGKVPFHNSIGIAIEKENGVFERVFEGPILSSNKIEPYFCGTGYVLKEKEFFKIWYLSCIGWIKNSVNFEPVYNIKYSISSNGVDWNQNGNVAINLEGDEGGLASASVIKISGLYLMWFSVRKMINYRNDKNNSYRIKVAISYDGLKWTRLNKKELELDVSDFGWDSEMVAYPNVILLEEKVIIFYNGNGFGKSGIGFAEMSLIDLENIINTI
jgi:hypothetical protein